MFYFRHVFVYSGCFRLIKINVKDKQTYLHIAFHSQSIFSVFLAAMFFYAQREHCVVQNCRESFKECSVSLHSSVRFLEARGNCSYSRQQCFVKQLDCFSFPAGRLCQRTTTSLPPSSSSVRTRRTTLQLWRGLSGEYCFASLMFNNC